MPFNLVGSKEYTAWSYNINPSQETLPDAAFHKLITYGLGHMLLTFHFSVSIVSLVLAFYDPNSDGCIPV